MWVPISKRSSDPDARKRREVNFGLVNNATGAAFGTVATAQAGIGARNAIRHKQIKSPKVARFVARHPKLARGRWVIPAAAALNVGGQALNAGLDAQSTSYFARERKSLSRKHNAEVKSMAKSDNGIGVFYDRTDEVEKGAWVDPEVRRQRELATTSTAAGLTGAGLLAYGGRNFLRMDPSTGTQTLNTHEMKLPPPKGARSKAWTMQRPLMYDNDLKPHKTYTHSTYPDTVGGMIRQGLKNTKDSRKKLSIPQGTSRLKAMRMRMGHSFKGRAGLPMALGLGSLGVSGAAYRLGHGKNERPWQ